MKKRLLFLMIFMFMFLGWSQNLINRVEINNALMELDYDYVLLDSGAKTLSKIIEEYNLSQNEDFIISPNPAKNSLNIKFKLIVEDLKLEVFDVLGKRIFKGEISQLESSINVSNWKSGVYLVRVSSTTMTKTKRFVKQ